jgi:hypothetical protein
VKRRFSLEEHWIIGTLLHSAHSAVQSLLLAVSKVYPLRSPQVRQLERAVKALTAARSSLDSAMFQEYGDAASTRAYYPGPAQRQEQRG